MFDEGRVVELNNQAKHAVTNRWSRNRVHLILDYVDVSFFSFFGRRRAGWLLSAAIRYHLVQQRSLFSAALVLGTASALYKRAPGTIHGTRQLEYFMCAFWRLNRP